MDVVLKPAVEQQKLALSWHACTDSHGLRFELAWSLFEHPQSILTLGRLLQDQGSYILSSARPRLPRRRLTHVPNTW